MLKVYGLKNCDTCRKAIKWLTDAGIAHEFCDLRAQPVSQEEVAQWMAAVGPDVLVNRRGTTWRKLSDDEKAVSEVDGLIDLMMMYPAMIKRPVFVFLDAVFIGFTTSVCDAIVARMRD